MSTNTFGHFEAQFHSGCLCCEGHISPGDDVKWADGEVIHAECDIFRDDRKPVSPACPTCFMVPAANGTCGCDA